MKVLTALLKYDYGKEERGDSLEYYSFFPAIVDVFDEVVPFWLEENGYPNNLNALQEKLINKTEYEMPDLIFFVLMGNEIRNETLDVLNKTSRTINWFCDDQWRFDSYSMYKAPHLSYIITVDKFSYLKYRKLGYLNVILAQWGVKNVSKDLNEMEYAYDISFVGSRNLTREWYIDELRNRGFKVACFGSGWEKGRVSYENMIEIFKKSKINLNISNSGNNDMRFFKFKRKKYIIEILNALLRIRVRKIRRLIKKYKYGLHAKNVEQIKARIFEVPAAGGFLLTQYAPEIEDYYVIGKEIVIFSSVDDLCMQLQYYLDNTEKRKLIAKNGYTRTKEYTYRKRMQKIRNYIEGRCDNIV